MARLLTVALAAACVPALLSRPAAADRSSENMDPAYMFEKAGRFEEAALYYHRALRGVIEMYSAFHWNRDPASYAAGKYSTEYVQLPKEFAERYDACAKQANLTPEQVSRIERLNDLWMGELVDQERGDQRSCCTHIAPVAEMLGDFRLAEVLRRGQARFCRVVAIPYHEACVARAEKAGLPRLAAAHRAAIKAYADEERFAELMAAGDKVLLAIRGFGGPSPWTGIALHPAKVNPVAFQYLPRRLFAQDEKRKPPGREQTAEMLKEHAMRHADEAVRVAAVTVLARLGERDALLDALSDDSPLVRLTAARAFAAMRWANGWGACHHSSDPAVRAVVAPLLEPAGKDPLARTWAITELIRGLGSTSARVRDFCHAALERITGEKKQPTDWPAWWKALGNARPGLLREGPDGGPQLDEALDFGAWWQSTYERAPNPLTQYEPPATVQWDGCLVVTQAGEYRFYARNAGEGRRGANQVRTPGRMGFPGLYLPGPSVKVTLDGSQVLPHPADAVQDPSGFRVDLSDPVHLDAGLHKLHVEFDYRSQPTGYWEPQPSVRLYWSSDQFVRQLIPADHLLTKD